MTSAQHHVRSIAGRLSLPETSVASTVRLLDDKATVPFIARYRKEATGSLDEVAIGAIKDLLAQRREIEARRKAIVASLDERDLLSETLLVRLKAADTLRELEDLYLPHRPKRRTRAMIARERGLEPLADLLMSRAGDPAALESFIDPERGVVSLEDALSGARDIVAERINEDERTRKTLRRLFAAASLVTSRVVEKKRDEALKYSDYFDWQEPVTAIAGHRLLALLRGEAAGLLRVSIRPDEEKALESLNRLHCVDGPWQEQIRLAAGDGYRRLLAPSLETELRNDLKERADKEAIAVFAANLRQLLLAPPLGQKRVMALDPGFRTGAKLVCLDAQGQLLHAATIYPTQGAAQREAAAKTVRELAARFEIEAVAVGSGTAGRETEEFVRQLGLADHILVTMVNEDGASVYSASELARSEFPDRDVTVRGAVSIGRRLQDPLAELVKIDPKSIGVGQYQHDVNQTLLKASLDDVVSSCVNSVGVELNSASVPLLTHVSGLGPALAANIVAYRTKHGPFAARKELLEVPRLGARAFEQAAGFLRVACSANPLDRSAVHPERYRLVEIMAGDIGCRVEDLMRSADLRGRLDLSRYVAEDVGLPTLRDIVVELAKPGRDPRPPFERFAFAAEIRTIEDLTPGMIVPAIITNVTKFGAFADIGVHRDGLIHISELADRYIKDPADVVSVRQQVRVRVIEVDRERQRISLSLKNTE